MKWTVGVAMGVFLAVGGVVWVAVGETLILASRKTWPDRPLGRQGQCVERLCDLCVAYWVAWGTYG